MNRRVFLARTGLGAVGLSLVACGDHRLIPLVDGVEVPFLTPAGTHYVKNGAEGSIRGWSVPRIDPAAWRLRIEGLVQTPLTLSLADLEAESAQGVAVLKTMQCVVDSAGSPGLVGTAKWWGVPLSIFLNRAGLDRERARRLHLFGADGFTNNLRVDRLVPDDPSLVEPLLVTRMDDAPLPREHGAPVRLLIADGFGYAQVKWLTRIEAVASDAVFGTYQEAGFTDEPRSPVLSKITAPSAEARIDAGPTQLLGFAVSGHAPVTQVEVRINDGPWQPARLADAAEVRAAAPSVRDAVQFTDAGFGWPLRGVWVPWSLPWDAPRGRHVIAVRATDATGQRQPEIDTELADGITASMLIRVEVV